MRHLGIGLIVLALLPAAAFAHEERPAFFPVHANGKVPVYRATGSALVVCKADSRRRIRTQLRGKLRKRNLALLKRCRYRHIQAAVTAAHSGQRILLLPGLYREEPSRAAARNDPRCAAMKVVHADGNLVPSYDYQRYCPNDRNLIAITGDTNGDRVCDTRCKLQIEGTGASPKQVVIEGDRIRENVIRADRADGIYLANFTIQYSDFNNVYVLETNGFRLDRLITRWSREYGILSFTSDNGLYENIEAYGAGDSGVYPGSGPEGHCKWYGIEIRYVNSHDNLLGYSGTAGNGVWVHHSRFHHNATGISTDSFASGHPGMPQDCAKWESNEIYSNNLDVYSATRDAYCKVPYMTRDPKIVCPSFQVPLGTGLLIAGGNGNIVRRNRVWDNWRNAFRLFWVPADSRGDTDPAHYRDTSHANTYTHNVLGVDRAGKTARNGTDVWWDEFGKGNCWGRNTGPGGGAITSDPKSIPSCPNAGPERTGDFTKTVQLLPCANWDPLTNPDPPGCDWFTLPPKPA